MDMSQITEFTILILLFGMDYYVYYTISLFKHLLPTLQLLHQNKSLIPFLYLNENYLIPNEQQSFNTFRIHKYYDYMKNLQLKYRDFIINDFNELLLSNSI